MSADSLDQRPENVPEEQWARLASNPANALQLPIRLTQAMLDTIDTSHWIGGTSM